MVHTSDEHSETTAAKPVICLTFRGSWLVANWWWWWWWNCLF